MEALLLPDLKEMIAEKDAAGIKHFLETLLPGQAAELLAKLPPEQLSYALELVRDDHEALIFEYLPPNMQRKLASGVGREELAKLVSNMVPDERVRFVRALPQATVDDLLPLMAQAERNDIKRLLSFEAGTAGSRMNTDYASITGDLTCSAAVEKVRNEAPDKETIYTVYVLDPDRHLEGVIGLKDLLLGNRDTQVSKLMRIEIVAVRGDEPVQKAAELVKKYDLIALPVLDERGRMLGIVTVDDLIDVMEQKATEEILSLGAVEPGALDKPYFENRIGLVVRKRVGWLLLLFVAEMFTGTVLRHFDEAIERVVALSFFIPLLIGTGGNAGSQTVSTIIRSLALKEIKTSDWAKILAREALSGLLLGLLLGVVGFGRSLMWAPGEYRLALTIGFTLIAICAWANAVAAMIPLFAQRAGMDPTVLSAPLITTLVDATGLILYFNIAAMFITKLAEPPLVIAAEIKTRILDVAKDAPTELADRLKELAGSDATQPKNEWLFPAIALVTLTIIFYMMSRRKPPVAA
jgi:magnesium transporter